MTKHYENEERIKLMWFLARLLQTIDLSVAKDGDLELDEIVCQTLFDDDAYRCQWYHDA